MRTETVHTRYFIIVFSICCLLASRAFAQKVDKIVAIVNSDVITEQDLAVFVKVTDVALEQMGGDPGDVRRLFLERLVEDQLILQAAKAQQMKVDEGALDDRIRDMKFRAGSGVAFDQALRSQGLSLTELRAKLREQYLVFSVVQREVRSKVIVTPREVTDYYQEHPSAFSVPESAVVDSVFVEKEEDAAAVRAALADAAAFEEVFREFSKRANLGKVRRGQLKKGLEDFVFALEPGVPSQPYAFDDGFYVFVLRRIDPPSREPLDEVKAEIKKKIEEEKFEKAYKVWIEGLKEKAYISIREE